MGSTRNDSTEEFGDNLSLLGDNDQQDNIESKRREVRAVFDVFDEQRCGSLDVIDVAHVVRCLGFNPTQHDLDASFSQLIDGKRLENIFERLPTRWLEKPQKLDQNDWRTVHNFVLKIAKGGSSRITFEHLFARVLAASENDEWHRGQIGELERAISIIAPQQPITKDYLITQLTSRGEPLNASEVNVLISHLNVRRNGEVDCAAYIKHIFQYIQQSNSIKSTNFHKPK